MSKTTTKIKINHDDKGHVTFSENGGPLGQLEISGNNNLEVKLGTGFSGKGAKITAMELFHSVNGAKGTCIGIWDRKKPSDQPSAEVEIAKKGSHIIVNDLNTTTNDDCFFFSVTATDGTKSYSSDPELRVKKISTG